MLVLLGLTNKLKLMRVNFYLLLAWISLFWSPVFILAQVNGGEDRLAAAFPYLTPIERTELKTAFLMATKKDSNLQEEWIKWLQDGGKITSIGSQADLESYRLESLSLEQKLRYAMLKEDVAIGPIVDRIDKHMPMLHSELQKTRSVPQQDPATTKDTSDSGN